MTESKWYEGHIESWWLYEWRSGVNTRRWNSTFVCSTRRSFLRDWEYVPRRFSLLDCIDFSSGMPSTITDSPFLLPPQSCKNNFSTVKLHGLNMPLRGAKLDLLWTTTEIIDVTSSLRLRIHELPTPYNPFSTTYNYPNSDCGTNWKRNCLNLLKSSRHNNELYPNL